MGILDNDKKIIETTSQTMVSPDKAKQQSQQLVEFRQLTSVGQVDMTETNDVPKTCGSRAPGWDCLDDA